MRSDTLRVPGATLYYEVRGSGPMLLLLPGGGGDAAVYDPAADLLADRFTVVTLDPRGYSRSRLDDEPHEQRVAVQSEDAAWLLAQLGTAPAYVFGGSSGAIVGLDLLARHPQRVARLVAHEPPCFAVLPDADAHRDMIEEVYRLFRAEGPTAAGARFAAAIGPTLRPMPQRPGSRATEMRARLAANGPLMLAYELREFTSYRPDFTALAAVADRLVVGAGRKTRGHLPHRPATEIAARLGLPLIEFPGAHNGLDTDTAEFAGQLAEILTAVAPPRSTAAR